MSNFLVRTGVDIILIIGNILSILFIVWTWFEYIFGLSHYVFITSCTPVTASCQPPSNNFRPAGNVPEYVGLDESLQKQAIFYGFYYFVLTSDMLRPILSIIWFLTAAHIRQSAILYIHAVTLLFGGLVEFIKLILYLVAWASPTSRFFAFAPSPLSSTVSTEFIIVLWSSVISIIFIVFQYILLAFLIRSVRIAIAAEERAGFRPINSSVGKKPKFMKPDRISVKNFLYRRVASASEEED